MWGAVGRVFLFCCTRLLSLPEHSLRTLGLDTRSFRLILTRSDARSDALNMASQPYTPKPATDLFTTYETSINRRECRRTVPMRLLALGLGRTGTASLRTALEELGFTSTYHMMCASVENPPDCLMWSDALAAKYDGVGTFGREQWDQLFGHCQAVCDWPCVAFAKELVEAYPEAKVLVTTRDVDSWHASTLKTVHWRATEPELKIAAAMGDWAARMYQPMLSSTPPVPSATHPLTPPRRILDRLLGRRLRRTRQAALPRILRRNPRPGPR